MLACVGEGEIAATFSLNLPMAAIVAPIPGADGEGEHGGDYRMTVKGNQPAVQAAVQAIAPDPVLPLLFR